MEKQQNYKVHQDAKIGHVHLTVGDLQKSLEFYQELLGFEIVTRMGDSAVFLSAGGYHHHIGLNTWAGKGALPAPHGFSGLYHFAVLLPNRKELAKVTERILKAHYPLEGAADHGVSEAIYLRDPDNNGVEIYVDRPQEQWTKGPDGNIVMKTLPLDLNKLLTEINN
ncbi:MAG: VOC family protein [Candidatus Doudnabacteria bacterium]|nr:VOC family protein [Candidatus Doudnabacteria bacterium]